MSFTLFGNSLNKTPQVLEGVKLTPEMHQSDANKLQELRGISPLSSLTKTNSSLLVQHKEQYAYNNLAQPIKDKNRFLDECAMYRLA
jgi:hypothetical protein